MKTKLLLALLFSIVVFGLKAQKREVKILDCNRLEYQLEKIITYNSLIVNEEYYIKFPHYEILEQNTESLLSSKDVKNVYWYNSDLYFTAKTDKVHFSYPGITSSKNVINCSSFYIAPASSLKMDGIQTENGFDIVDLISQDLLGDLCISVSNVDGPSNSNGFGVFTNGMSYIGIDEGIVLLTGNISSAEGPNTANPASDGGQSDGADPDLSQLIGSVQRDVVKVEFDFVPDEDKISFDYVFASEEYCDYVNSSFNDVFGFFISGPGISGPFQNGAENIAVVPGTTNPVTINNINWTATPDLYNTNEVQTFSGGCTNDELNAPTPFVDLFGLDGFTNVLRAEADVIPCETYHIKLVIADIVDGLFDSGIFLGQNSFISGDINTTVNLQSGSVDGDDEAEEGCENAFIAFNIDPPIQDITFTLDVQSSSTATAGVDYETIPTTYTVPLGVEFDTLWIDVFGDALVEGIETIDILVTGVCGCEDPLVTILIEDPPFYEMDVVLCDGEFLTTSEGQFDVPGQYYSVVETPGECDSLFLIDLSFNPIPVYDTTIYRCTLEPLEFLGETFMFAPDFKQITLEAASIQGCDSIINVNFQWANPDLLIATSNDFSCTDTIIDLFILNNPIPPNIDSLLWVTPNLDTIQSDILQADSPGTYQLLSFIFLEDRVCPNFFPNEIDLEPSDDFPIIEELEDIIVFCNSNIPEILPTIQNSDSLGILDYHWILPDGTIEESLEITPTIEGDYTFVAINLDGNCESEQSFNFGSTDTIPNIDVFHDGIGCSVPSVTMNSIVDIPGGIYTWTGPNGFMSNEENPEVSVTGEYTLVYSISPDCVNSTSTFLSNNDSIPVLTAIGDTIICQQGTGQLTFQADTIESFFWTGPNNFMSQDSFPEVLEEGIYTIQVNAFNGCINQFDVNLTHIEIVPELTTLNDTINCNNLFINLNAATDIENSVNWSGPNNFSATDLNPTVTIPGVYTIEVTNEEGCKLTEDVLIEIDTISPSIDIEGDSILNCLTNEVEITLHSQVNLDEIIWSGPNSFTSNSTMLQLNEAGAYNVNVVGKNGCISSQEYIIQIDTLSPAFIPINDTIDCNSGEATLTLDLANSDFEVAWYDIDNTLLDNTTNELIVDIEGVYNVIVTNPNNFCTSESTIQAFENILSPSLELNGEILTCEDKIFHIFSNSNIDNLTYTWTGPNGFTSDEQNPEITEGGTYLLQVISQDDCITNGQIEVFTDLVKPQIETKNDTINCLINEVTLALSTTNDDVEFNWSKDGDFYSNEQSPIATEGGVYQVIVTSSNFCDTSSFIEITVDTSVLLIDGVVSNILDCTNENASISINTDYPENTSFQWTSDNFSDDSQSIIVQNAGTYNLIVTAENGCTKSEEFIVEDDFSVININAENGLINCFNPTYIILTDLSSNLYETVQWQGPESFSSNEISPEVTQGGEYVITVIGNNGCSNTLNIEVESDFDEPIVLLNEGQLACNQTSVEIGNELDADYIYEWSSTAQDVSNESSPFIQIMSAGSYDVTVTDTQNGCTSESTTSVVELPEISGFNFETDNPDCFNPFGNIEITDVFGGTAPLEYSIDGGQTFQLEPVFTDLNASTYNLIVRDPYECSFKDSAVIISLQDFDLLANGPFEIIAGNTQQLNVITGLPEQDIVSISWTPDENLSCTSCLNPISSTLKDIEYTVTVIDKDGCIYETKIQIRVIESPYYIPNVFTPNGDGQNEYFSIFGDLEKIQNVNEFSIYDRWGEKVFTTEDVLATDESMKWFGEFNGQPAKAGVYAYYIEYVSITGEIVNETGDVTILR